MPLGRRHRDPTRADPPGPALRTVGAVRPSDRAHHRDASGEWHRTGHCGSPEHRGLETTQEAGLNAPMIRRLLQRRGLGTRRPIWSGNVPRASDDEMTIQELATQLGAHRQTVYGWLRRGKLKGRLAKAGTQRIWLLTPAQASTRTSNRESS